MRNYVFSAANKFWGGTLLILCASNAHAGMTVYDLNDVVKLRLQDISFFAFLLLLATAGVRLLWNYLAKDFDRLPRLSFVKALSLTALISIALLLVLAMISGARELLTPGAWYRQGSHYRPNDIGNAELRQQSMQNLREALRDYAKTHEGHFPPHDYVMEIPDKLWQAPDSSSTRYIYIGGLQLSQSNSLLACEPPNFGPQRLVLFWEWTNSALKKPGNLSAHGSCGGSMKIFRTLFLAFVAVAVFLTLTVGLAPLFVPFTLFFGWIFSAGRLIHAFHPNTPALLVFGGAAVVLIAGTDAFLRWLFRSMKPSSDSLPSWRLKWTLCGYGILFCALISIASLVLTTHQLFWISRSTEPWFIDTRRPHMSLILTAGNLYHVAETNQWDTARTRTVFRGMNSSREACPVLELFRPVWIEKDKTTLRAILLLPRQAPSRAMPRFAVLEPGSYYRTKDLSVFDQVLRSYDSKGISVNNLPP